MKELKKIIRLARLHFLAPGFMLYLFGYLLALLGGIQNDIMKFIFGYFVFGSAHLSVSFSNDYFDRHSDRNSSKTSFSGGSKVLVENPELENFALAVAIILLGISIIANSIFTLFYGYSIWFFLFGLFGGLLGWFYTAPPLKFAYRGLGEISTMLAVGLFMPGMGYLVATSTLDSLFQLFILPLSCYGLFFIITVETPDVESDTVGDKKNILVTWGLEKGKQFSLLVTVIGTSLLTLMLLFGIKNEVLDWGPFVLFSFFPLLASLSSYLTKTNSRKIIEKQVMINMSSMILFLLLMNLGLITQFII